MKLHFAKSDAILSKLIRWTFNEPVSHFAIEFDGKWIIHTDLMGVEVEWSDWFRNEHTIVSTLSPVKDLTLEEEEKFYQKALMSTPKKPGYDYGAFFYFAWRGFLFKVFGEKIPNTNPYQSHGALLCTEEANFFGLLNADATMDLSITTPWKLRDYFLSTGDFKEEVPK